jgi:hypothetical protein
MASEELLVPYFVTCISCQAQLPMPDHARGSSITCPRCLADCVWEPPGETAVTSKSHLQAARPGDTSIIPNRTPETDLRASAAIKRLQSCDQTMSGPTSIINSVITSAFFGATLSAGVCSLIPLAMIMAAEIFMHANYESSLVLPVVLGPFAVVSGFVFGAIWGLIRDQEDSPREASMAWPCVIVGSIILIVLAILRAGLNSDLPHNGSL